MQVHNIFLYILLVLPRSLLWLKRAAWVTNPHLTTGPGSVKLHSAVIFFGGVCMIIFCEGNDTEIPVIKGRVDRWVEEEDYVMVVFSVYSPANATQTWIELPQNITCELALDLMTGIHSTCIDQM